MKNKKLYKLTICAMMIALATVLSVIKLWHAPLGGSVTLFSMLPICFVSIYMGVKWGVATGFIYGVIQLFLGMDNFAYIPTTLGVIGCILFDYILPFTLVGFAGIFNYLNPKTKKGKIVCVAGGVALACVLRFLCHWVFGAIAWYEITKDGQWNDYVNEVGMWLYSFVYNITYLGPDSALVIIASPVIITLRKILSDDGKA